ncbi:MAG: hypothetical protein VZR28_04070 [Candidatus Cryptobacteroides sp.]|nr:hypothetical protein [Bacteroidales bacterium]MDY6378060.1 hypothetical protein [Bacteroidales bacterium]MDY6384071.1 hypothetical protein [Bacteroidales bacterium]MEE3390347.1 hypothetical protein [Candidatus Cryptobacteroides sp.]MEE3429831.1 hypothetical protein [Candidatus Cryptobacteroides sp.]
MSKLNFILSIFAGIFAFSATNVSAQIIPTAYSNPSAAAEMLSRQGSEPNIVPGQIRYCGGDLVDSEGNVIKPEDIRFYIGNQIYEDTYVGARKQLRSGKTLVWIGAPVAVAGIVMMIAGLNSMEYDDGEYYDYGLYSAGLLAGLAGSTCIDVGIPLLVIGKKRLEWIADDYNGRLHGSRRQPYISTSSKGFGIALNF